MTQLPEVLWHNCDGRDFLTDLKGLCNSLDDWSVSVDLTAEQGQWVHLDPSGYNLETQALDDGFLCPECSAGQFDVLEGLLSGKPILGLACRQCGSYGLVAPEGL